MSSFGWDNFWIDEKKSFYAIMKIATGYLTAQIDKTFHLKPTDDILDYGCGMGSIPDALAAKKIPVTGVDINDFFIELCRKNHPDSFFFQITTDVEVNKKILDEQLKGRKFDYIILSSVVQYLKTAGEFEDIIKMLRLYLKNQGKIIVADVIDEKTSSFRDTVPLFFHCFKIGKIAVFVRFIFYVLFSDYRKVSKNVKLLELPEESIRAIAENNLLDCEKMGGLTLHPTRWNYILSKKIPV
jgi:2-polyprenyl-3-methyl-5-hydroxy-6-metoxy-1,4-benzoquinol methylase